MSQLELQEALHKATLCLMRDDFEGVFAIADEVTRKQHAGSLEDAAYRDLMVHAWFAACVSMTHAVRSSAAWRFAPISQQKRPEPGLRVGADPYGVTRLFGLHLRYMRQAGHTPRSGTDLAVLRFNEIRQWYKNLQQPIIKIASARTWTASPLNWVDRLAKRFDKMLAQAVTIARFQALHPEYFRYST